MRSLISKRSTEKISTRKTFLLSKEERKKVKCFKVITILNCVGKKMSHVHNVSIDRTEAYYSIRSNDVGFVMSRLNMQSTIVSQAI